MFWQNRGHLHSTQFSSTTSLRIHHFPGESSAPLALIRLGCPPPVLPPHKANANDSKVKTCDIMASEVGEWSPRVTSSASYHEQLKYTCWMKSWEQYRLLPKLIPPLFTKSCTRAHRNTPSTCQLCNTRARKHLANELIQQTIIMRNLVICNRYLASWTNARDNLASHETWSQFSESPASTAVDGDAVSWHHAKVQRVI